MSDEYWYVKNNKGHVWKTEDNGEIDVFGLDYETHNGPIRTVCDYAFCEHCEREEQN